MNTERGMLGSFVDWLAHPFNSQGSAFNWVMFTGLVIIAAWMWTTVLHQITRE